ncbi:hypothetical protein [Pandoraea pulmonicola]|uniref:Uncharacterized protein n=1 Tax=Pandoraea pulmonicola TaxID=93221 RepID=A0AAJ5CZR9_PANPU|nr:hypothetical protein [Pandoraea pulmonicola]SUA90006.1 Uncharacterised protein [Pandoraea pulmonicola]
MSLSRTVSAPPLMLLRVMPDAFPEASMTTGMLIDAPPDERGNSVPAIGLTLVVT